MDSTAEPDLPRAADLFQLRWGPVCAERRERVDDRCCVLGDVAHPTTTIPTIAAAVASGANMNEWVHESIECSGAGPEPFTDAQFESTAQLAAAASRALGLPINRSTWSSTPTSTA